MFYIVGLGNPGDEYIDTRHNVGFAVLQYLQETHNLPKFVTSSKFSGDVCEGVLPGGEVMLLKPTTFMNNSGSAVKKFLPAGESKQLIVIYDDVDLPLGDIKVSVGKGDGGHNGVASIILNLKTKDFVRVRVGISPKSFWTGKVKRPSGAKLSSHVLGHFKRSEQDDIETALKQADEAITTIMSEGVEVAMNTYN